MGFWQIRRIWAGRAFSFESCRGELGLLRKQKVGTPLGLLL
ncbi:hypothetical protein [Campylobacter upsaliensis]|nr:hypothetical protein [Campylobacter upsaliensis]